MHKKQYEASIANALNLVTEAIRPQDFKKSGDLILNYLKKNGFTNAVKMPGYEPFQNTIEKGVGVRYFYNSIHSVRINWAQNAVGTATISSADLWFDDKNTTGGADIHINFGKQISLVKALPSIVAVMKDPKIGSEYIFEVASQGLIESISNFLSENAINVHVDVAQKFIDKLEDGKKVAELLKEFGAVGHKILNKLKDLYPNNFEKRGVAFFFKGKNSDINIDKVLSGAGGTKVTVTKGASSEKILNTAADTKLEADGDRLVFEEQLNDLRSVTKLLLSGAAWSMFLAGKGGVGKTHTVEEILHAAGKTDGDGYFKITGTASPIGIYKTLYKNRTGIILFDDCDGALGDQDARNIIKAATDTKKIRKLVWMKKPSKSEMYDPDDSEDAEDDDSEDARVPTYFNFEGRVIFISNLPLAKLDPDGALRTRSFVVNIDPTDLELIDYMAKIAPSIPLEEGLYLTKAERNEVTELLRSMVGKRAGLSLRNLVRGLNIRASGLSNWQDIVKRYA